MSELTVQDGKLVVRDGALGTGQGCCCCGCCGYCIESFYDMEIFSQGCPEGWTQDFTGTCVRYRLNVSSCDCGNYNGQYPPDFPIECDGCLTPEGLPCCQTFCDYHTAEPCPACAGTCTTSEDCQTGCQCVFTGSRYAIPPESPDPYTPDFDGQQGKCCIGAAVYQVILDGPSFAGWDLLSNDCPSGYAPPTSEQVIDCEPALTTCVNCCIPNQFP